MYYVAKDKKSVVVDGTDYIPILSNHRHSFFAISELRFVE